jgi:hypothetical protein
MKERAAVTKAPRQSRNQGGMSPAKAQTRQDENPVRWVEAPCADTHHRRARVLHDGFRQAQPILQRLPKRLGRYRHTGTRVTL